MGNQLLTMKKMGVVALLAVTALNAEITINDIDKLVNDIKEERVGLKSEDIKGAKDPFIYPRGKFVKPIRTAQTGKNAIDSF